MDPNFKPYRMGKLTVLERYPCAKRIGQKGRNNVYYLCRCGCGKEIIFSGDEIIKRPYSCGREKNPKGRIDCKGAKMNARNRSGAAGVYYDSKRKKWRAEITFKQRKHFLGYFEPLEEAVKAKKEAVDECYRAKDKEEQP